MILVPNWFNNLVEYHGDNLNASFKKVKISGSFAYCFKYLKKHVFFLTLFLMLKVAFIQKGLMNLSFLQTDEPNYSPELNF